ncbi:MAG: sodium-translocating pyrophosphatase [Candidatus Bathyarchaeia archaeon]|nr:sodium-translocating pyrophosphatase [Candidatus Bathyarchaeota archaeon]
MLDPLISLVLLICVIALALVAFLSRYILVQDSGTEKMREIALAIKSGSEAYLKRQYKSITVIAVIFALLFALAIRDTRNPWLGIQTSFGFILGALCSNLAGYIAMQVAVLANVRTASAVRKSFDKALKIAFRGGLVFGLAVVSMSLLGITGLYLLFNKDPRLIVGFGFGASFAALFAQLGGGIYTKAADMSADLVGKIEAGIPEDDPRNPAVIADNVGDNVGDIAGRGADLFESITAENIGAMILGLAPAIFSLYGVNGVIFPLIARAFGLIATILGMFFVYAKREDEDPFKPLIRGLVITSVLCMIFFYILVKVLLNNALNLFLAAVVGIIAAALIALITNYYTSYSKRPVLEIVESAKGGPGPGIATGLAIGMESTGIFIVVVSISILASFALGGGLPVLVGKGSWEAIQKGIYGTAIATMGMLSVTPMILALDGFGPIVDNSSGILEMAGLGGEGKEISEKMDAIGNTTKALTKGYAVGSASLSAFLLFFAFLEVVELKGVDLSKPATFIGAFIGAMLIFLFSALAIKAVGKTSAKMIEEIRRQFKEIPGILEGKAKPDYAKCIDISTKAALKNMVAPGVLIIIVPVVVGLVLGVEALGALQMVGIIAGVLMALFMNNGGAAMDNSKKYIEAGNLGGKGSPIHAATVIGDTLGDPLKDTAGPSIHVVIKLLNTIALALAPLFILYSLL